MNILSINRVTDDIFSCFVEDDTNYMKFDCSSAGIISVRKFYLKSNFKNFEEFKAKMGKFNPYVKFLKEKRKVDDVNFSECKKIQEELK